MKNPALFFLFFLSTSAVFAQLDSNTITVTASRTSNPLPDQVGIYIDVNSPLSTSLDDVLAALNGLNLTTADLQNVSSNRSYFGLPSTMPGPPTLDWTFRFAVPFSKLKDTIAMLTALQKSVPQSNSALMFEFGVEGARASSQALQMQGCSVPGLLDDARSQAKNIASAANAGVGDVLGMSTATVALGDCSSVYYCFAPPCTLTVKFALTR